jgi:hypothetical protein
MEGRAVDGEVAITGPGRLAGSLTPDAARRSARLLSAMADEAAGQGAALDEPTGDDAAAAQDSQTSSSEP